MPLSALDTFLFVRYLQVPVTWFYRGSVDAEMLAASLSRTLERFPILAGACFCADAPQRGVASARGVRADS